MGLGVLVGGNKIRLDGRMPNWRIVVDLVLHVKLYCLGRSLMRQNASFHSVLVVVEASVLLDLVQDAIIGIGSPRRFFRE